MRRNRRPAAVMLALGLAGVAVLASGCTLASPKTIVTPYAAADGSNTDVDAPTGGAVQLRNFLLISAGKNHPGVLVGAVTTDSVQAVPMRITVLDADGTTALAQTSLQIEPGRLATFGADGGASLQVPALPAPPGATVTVKAETPAGGRTFTVPVLMPQGFYSGITATEAPSPTSESPTPSASPSTSPKASASASPSGTAG